MNKFRKYIPATLLLLSLPFYFLGVFTLRSERGEKIMGSLRFWYIGLTGNYSDYKRFFYTKLANFINAVVVLFIISIVFMIIYFCVYFFCANRLPTKKYISVTFAFEILSFAFFISGVLFEAFFYSNKFHACYIIQNEGRLGFGIYIAFLLHSAAFVISYLDYLRVVFNPYLYGKNAVKGIIYNDADKNIQQNKTDTTCVCTNEGGLKYYLLCTGGSFAGGRIELKENYEIKIGKDPKQCALIVDRKYKNVSRVHCGVLRKNTDFYVIDYSSNGTFVTLDDSRMQNGGILNKIAANQTFNLAHTDNEFYCQIDKK